MRVVVHVSHFFDWQPVPKDVDVTEKDVASGLVKPNARNDGHLMRVERKLDTHTEVHLSESTIIARIIHEAMPQNGGLHLTRRKAIANVLAHNVMPHHAHPKRFRAIEVDADDGPDEEGFRAALTAYVEAKHANGLPLIDPDDVESMVAAYMEPTTEAEHAGHLHAHFRVKQSARPAGAAQ